MINLYEQISYYYKNFEKLPYILKRFILYSLNVILKLDNINDIISRHKENHGISFIEELFEHLDFSFILSQKDLEKIPSQGRLLIYSNHPLGALDALSVIKAVANVRSDIKIIANNILMQIPNLNELLLPYNIFSFKYQRENLKQIGQAFENEEAVIIFPAAEVSRLSFGRIKDKKWRKGIVYFARKYNAPLLPVYIKARNSMLFYVISWITNSFSTLLLSREMFMKRHKNISLRIGEQIPESALKSLQINDRELIKLLKKHLYNIGRNKKGIFKTEKNIIFPVDRKRIKQELLKAELLGVTTDNKKILLTNYDQSPGVVKEIARLRELTFRKVGEGTGKKIDIDSYDRYYKHLILWDDQDLEIVGSYRIGICDEIIPSKGIDGLYTSSLFNINREFEQTYFAGSIELGRSFVQKKYWNSNALENLWQGLGAYLCYNKNIKYMFGAVSISNNYPEEAKRMLTYFYRKWFSPVNNFIVSKKKYTLSQKDEIECSSLLTYTSLKEDYFKLKTFIKIFGFSVPPLLKHYSDLCENGGFILWDFGIDADFADCIDGFITVEVDKIKKKKADRYINCHGNSDDIVKEIEKYINPVVNDDLMSS